MPNGKQTIILLGALRMITRYSSKVQDHWEQKQKEQKEQKQARKQTSIRNAALGH